MVLDTAVVSGSAQECLAFDDALLARGEESFRLWEGAAYAVVLGRSCQADDDVDLEACASANIPVLRRSSGGGTVVQGPGCLNYSFILDLTRRPELNNVEKSYSVILGRVAAALRLPDLRASGSDLLLGERKVSGSAQRRIHGWLLHHGTLLYGLDARLVARLLREPVRQPLHRRGRSHCEFLGTVPVARHGLVARLASIPSRSARFHLLSLGSAGP